MKHINTNTTARESQLVSPSLRHYFTLLRHLRVGMCLLNVRIIHHWPCELVVLRDTVKHRVLMNEMKTFRIPPPELRDFSTLDSSIHTPFSRWSIGGRSNHAVTCGGERGCLCSIKKCSPAFSALALILLHYYYYNFHADSKDNW